MKLAKIYLVIATIFLVVALGLGVYVWYVFQDYTARIETGALVPSEKTVMPATTAPIEEGIASTTHESSEEAPTVISIDQLTETQRSVLSTFGIEGESFTVTEGMITCATEGIGKARFTEIINGAAPSPFEMVKLLPCMKK